MDTQILIQYVIVLLSLVLLEGLLSADNAIVLAVMVRHLPPKEQKHALMYGLAGALIFRIIAIFLITIWATVIKVELTDIAFAIDSILAAVAIAITLPHISETSIGGINLGQFAVMVIGGFIGVIIMRYAANIFIKVLETKPGLEIAAFLIVGWVGIKLFVIAAAHEKLALIPHEFPHSTLWTVIFWVVLLGLLVWGVLVSKKFEEK